MSCKFCGYSGMVGMSLQGGKQPDGERPSFRYLADGEKACIECYIDEGVRQSIDKLLEGKIEAKTILEGEDVK